MSGREISVTDRETGNDDDVSETQGWDDTSRAEIRRKVAKFLRTH